MLSFSANKLSASSSPSSSFFLLAIFLVSGSSLVPAAYAEAEWTSPLMGAESNLGGLKRAWMQLENAGVPGQRVAMNNGERGDKVVEYTRNFPAADVVGGELTDITVPVSKSLILFCLTAKT